MNPIGKYSGSERLDPKKMQEPDPDSEYTAKMWFQDIQNDPDFLNEIQARVNGWYDIVKMTTDQKLDIHMIGESHIDVAWKWRYEQTRQKAIKTFAKAVYHAKKFPKKFCFALSEPLLLEWVKEDDPKLFKEIQATVKTGGIELVGGSYVEPDCMMPSGEAFVRSRLYGQRFLKENFNQLAEVEWFLDSFGYNYGLPQILVKSGATAFWTSKITWNRQTVFPFVNFWWEGPDGTKLMTANFSMGMGGIDKWMMYEMGRRPLTKEGRKVWNYTFNYEEIDEHVEADEICPLFGNFFGRGDGGHGPAHQEVAEANAYAQLGVAHWSRVKTFFDEMRKWSDRFPIWDDELYLEYHRGTFTVHAEVKRHNRLYENQLTAMETLAMLATLTDPKYKYPFEIIERRWKTLLKNQFHDVLPGSSIPEVYDDVYDDWEETDKILDSMKSDIGTALSISGKTLDPNSVDMYLYNPLAWKRHSPVFIPITILKKSPTLDKEGKPNYAKLTVNKKDKVEYIAQPSAAEPKNDAYPRPAGWWVVPELDATSSVAATLVILSKEESQACSQESDKVKTIAVSEDSISNGVTSMKIAKDTGAILELVTKGVNSSKNVLKGDQSNLFFGYLDDYPNDHAWNIKPEYWRFPLVDMKNNENVKISVTQKGPVFSTVEISRSLGKDKSKVIQKITLFQGCPEVYFEWISDWKQTFVFLKVLYSTATNAEEVVSDCAYAAITRKTEPQSPCDKARYEKIQHKYSDISAPDKKWGVALINEGKYAFDTLNIQGVPTKGDIKLSLLRTPRYPTAAGEAWVNQERKIRKEKYNTEVPEFSGLGPNKCRYVLLPHPGGSLLNADGSANNLVKRAADEFNQPVMVIPTTASGYSADKLGTSGASFIEIKTPNVFLGALKLNEWERSGTVILRVVEGCGIPANAEIKLNPVLVKRIKSVKAVDLLEKPIQTAFKWDAKNCSLSFKMGKFEICTFEFEV
jgi:alpha-mannosidase